MNRPVYPLLLVIMMTMFVNPAYAEPSTKSLPVIEVRVLTLAATQADGELLSIPRTALTAINGIPGVFVVEKNEARFRMVRPGKTSAGRQEILSGLFGNEHLIISELEAVHDGSPVTIVTQKSSGKK